MAGWDPAGPASMAGSAAPLSCSTRFESRPKASTYTSVLLTKQTPIESVAAQTSPSAAATGAATELSRSPAPSAVSVCPSAVAWIQALLRSTPPHYKGRGAVYRWLCTHVVSSQPLLTLPPFLPPSLPPSLSPPSQGYGCHGWFIDVAVVE